MADQGLKIVVGADFKDAESALKKFTSTAASTGKLAGTSLSSGLNKSVVALDKLPKSSNAATLSLVNLGRVAQDAPFGFLGIANNLNPLLESFQRLKAESGSSKVALKSLVSSLSGAGGLGLALSVASSLAIVFGDKLFSSSKKVDEAAEAAKKYKESIEGIFSSTAQEATEVSSLVAVLRSETETRNRKLDAIKELQKIQPEVFNGLKLEGNAVKGLEAAYDSYLKNLSTVIAVKIKQVKLEELITKQLKAQGATLTKSEKSVLDGIKKISDERDKQLSKAAPTGLDQSFLPDEKVQAAFKKRNEELAADIKQILDDITELSKGVKIADTNKVKANVDDVIDQAKRLAAFLDKNTQFEVNFEVDETISEEANKEAARRFIAKARSFIEQQTPEFKFKPLLRTEFKFINDGKFLKLIRDQAGIEATKTYAEVKKEFEENIKRLAESNPIIIETNAKIKQGIERERLQNSQLASGLGLKIPGINEAESALTSIQKESIAAANNINSILTPAFQSLFTSIKAGENPLKGFFASIGQAVEQLIQKLIAAAVQALILSAIFPGGVGGVKGFGGFFKNVLGFAAGGVVTGPTLALIGEGRGTSSTNPEIVAPLDKLRGMLAGLGSTQPQIIIVNGRTRGNQFQLLANRTTRQNGRLGAR